MQGHGNSHISRNAFAALEFEPNRIAMSEEGRSANEHAASVHQEHSHKHSRHALADVEQQCRRRCALLACAKHVGSADVARPDLAQIPDPCCFRSEEHTSELQSLMRQSYAVFCLKTKKKHL